jgi:hypothetical protein
MFLLLIFLHCIYSPQQKYLQPLARIGKITRDQNGFVEEVGDLVGESRTKELCSRKRGGGGGGGDGELLRKPLFSCNFFFDSFFQGGPGISSQ